MVENVCVTVSNYATEPSDVFVLCSSNLGGDHQ